jgi:uncharacterized protein (TIGR03435 family)
MQHVIVSAVIFLNICFVNAHAQSFEVASVKRNTSDEPPGGGISRPLGGFQANNVTLRTLIRTAYDLENFQVLGGPKWLDKDKFDVAAKASGSPSWPEIRTMLQVMLADRFKLSLSRESRVMSVYVMTVAKKGPKLEPPSDAGCEQPPFGSCSTLRLANRKVLSGVNVSTAQLARVLTTFMRQPVVDVTGLDSIFNFKMEFALDLPGSSQSQDTGDTATQSAPSVFTAIEEQLGLKLVAEKAPVDVLVISAGEQPTPN